VYKINNNISFETMRTKMLIKNQNGGAAVEFAIILPFLIFLIFGIIEGGLLLYNDQVLTNASREGARAGVVVGNPRLSDAGIQAVIDKYADKHLVTFGNKNFPSAVILPAQSSRVGNLFGTDLSVEITYDYNFLVLKAFGFGPITLRAKTIMKME
jgi:hypothetical protein